LFTDNDAFFGGVHREQDPVGAVQLHASYTFRPRLWFAIDSTWSEGATTRVGGDFDTIGVAWQHAWLPR